MRMTLVDRLKKYDPSLTVDQLIEQVEREQLELVEKEEYDFQTLAQEFKNVYLKRVDKGLLGKQLEVYHIEKLTNKARTTSWSLIYYIKGTRIAFAERDLFIREYTGEDANNSFSEEELRGMEVISEEDYLAYLNEYEKIRYELKSLIEGHYHE